MRGHETKATCAMAARERAVLGLLQEVGLRRYSVVLEPIREPDFEGHYYAHVPALDLTTHGEGIEGALKAARELTEAWVAEKQAHGEAVPEENATVFAQIEIADALSA